MSTLTDARHRASEPRVKGKSEFGEKSRRGWLRKRQAETPATPAVERSTFPRPDAPTQVLPEVPAPRPAGALPPVLYRERPGDIDKAAHNIALAATSAALHRWSAIHLEEALAVHLRVLHGLAEQERTEGRKLLERPANAEAANAAVLDDLRGVVEAEQKANELPGVTVKAHIDTDALGSGLGAVWANAQRPQDETAQFQRITPGMPDPRVQVSVTTVTVDRPASPVRVPGSGSTPPVPAGAVTDTVAREPLPHRTPHLTAFEARLDGAELLDGEPAKAGGLPELVENLGPLWLAHRGFWHRIVAARVDGPRVHVTLDGGVTDCPAADAVVHVLHESDAKRLRSGAVDQ